MKLETIGVIGAGVIGRSVAQDLAQTGHQVVLVDVCQAALTSARQEIQQNARLFSLFNQESLIEDPDEVAACIQFTTDFQLLQDVSFIIENVTEQWAIKQPLYQRLDSICSADAIFAANTSAIPITQIAAATKRPSQVIGLHFMNPVPLKPVVELIRGYHTSEETLETTKALLQRMNKRAVVVNDAPGFISNRVMMVTVNEAAFLLQEQVASAEDVDEIFKTCYGHTMGPLETADLIGLDTILNSIEVLYKSFNDSKYRPCPLLKKMVDAGLYGRKSGQGFYSYHIS